MILDSSAVLAVLLEEPGYESPLERLTSDPAPGIGAPTLAEAGIVAAARLGIAGRTLLGRFVQETGVVVVPFGEEHWGVAIEAFLRFGKGRHPAGLNLGDCMTYATAHLADEPLLCLGEDFAKTDLALAR